MLEIYFSFLHENTTNLNQMTIRIVRKRFKDAYNGQIIKENSIFSRNVYMSEIKF